MTALAVRVPAADRVDHRAVAYNAACALADLTGHLDPALLVTLDIGARGRLGVMLHSDSRRTGVPGFAVRADVEQLAVRLGLAERTPARIPGDDGVMRRWAGQWAGHAVEVSWIDPDGVDQ